MIPLAYSKWSHVLNTDILLSTLCDTSVIAASNACGIYSNSKSYFSNGALSGCVEQLVLFWADKTLGR